MRKFLVGIAVLSSTLALRPAAQTQTSLFTPHYRTTHPRLPFPSEDFLARLAKDGKARHTYEGVADQWDSTKPGNYVQLRRLVIAYLVEKNTDAGRAERYLSKIKALADLGGTWGRLLHRADDGLGTGDFRIKSPTTNFMSACAGKSCAGEILSIEGRAFRITKVIDEHTVELNHNHDAPTGTGLKIRLFGNKEEAGLNLALIYDWLYSDLDSVTRAEFLQQLEVLCSEWEENYVGTRASPLNDVFYIDVGNFGLVGALAIYPDHPNSLKHLQFATDVWFNVVLPAWSQVFGPGGGGWHEAWPDYVNAPAGTGMTTFVVPTLLCWQSATGEPIFTEKPWLKNFGYYTMYMTRPDFLLENIGDISRPYLNSEYNLANGAGLGSLNGLAEIYNDPVLRGWARQINRELPSGPTGFEPSAWPFYEPDNNSKPVSQRSALPPVHNFTGFGLINMRTGWTEEDTSISLKYGDNFWSHEHADIGSFTIFHRGNLAIDSGSYRPGYSSKHVSQYARQTIAHNTLTITDPADVYSTGFLTTDQSGERIQMPLSNDGGQRRVGSPYNEHFPQLQSPFDMGQWMENWDYFHMGQLIVFASTPNYTYAVVDMTAAYNNRYSGTQPNATNRTNRVSKAVRHIVMIPRGTDAYIVILDQVESTNPSFKKKWLLHTINKPVINGNRFQVTRDELVTPKPYADLWPNVWLNQLRYAKGRGAAARYKYDGTLHGWTVAPEKARVDLVGGPGREFWIEDPLHPGTGTNWNQCMPGQCAANKEGFGPIDDVIQSEPGTAPHEPGSWRIEVQPATAEKSDDFLHVLLACNTGDNNVPETVEAAGQLGATWKDNGHTYKIEFDPNGTGGHITISGVRDESLLAHAQSLPGQLLIVSGDNQQTTPGEPLPQPLIVAVEDLSGNRLPKAAVHFALAHIQGHLSSETVFTDKNGYAQVEVTPGELKEEVQARKGQPAIFADVNGIRPVGFHLHTEPAQRTSQLRFVPASYVRVREPERSTSQSHIENGKWTMIKTSGYPVQTVGWENLAYAPPPVDKTFILGDYHELSSEPNDAIGAYDFETNRWSVLDVGSSFHSEYMPEAGHPTDSFTYDPNNKVLVYYCCHSGSNQPENTYWMWWYDPVGQVGRAKPTLNKPGTPTLDSAAFDIAAHKYVLEGGGSGVGTWVYDPQTNIFRAEAGKGDAPPPSLSLPAMAYDTNDKKIYAFGGRVGPTFYDDLLTYEATSQRWTRLSPDGPKPSPRWGAALAYDSAHNVFLLYGGQTAKQVFNDTWIYDPQTSRWAELTPPVSPPVGAIGPRQTLAYDSAHNVFILVTAGRGGYAEGAWNGYGAQVWMFRYKGGGPDPGSRSIDPSPDPGSINRNSDGWAKEPVLTSDGKTLYVAWVETGKPFETGTETWLHPYMATYSGSWKRLADAPSSLDSEFNGYSEAHSPSITLVNGKPWISWYKWNNSGHLWAVYAKHWNGSEWVGGAIGRLGKDPRRAFQGPSQVVDVAGTPYVAFLETDKSLYPQRTFLYVKFWNGSDWVLKGSGPLNLGSGITVASSLSLTSDGSNPIVAWSEYAIISPNQKAQSDSQVHVAKWSGGRWTTMGSALNPDRNSWADNPSIAYQNGTWVAWTEHTQAGNSRVLVRNLDGGQPIELNRAPDSWAVRPSLISANGNLYVGWVEQRKIGDRAQCYVSELKNGQWIPLGGSLNVSPDLGSAQRVGLSVVNGEPVAAWGEVKLGSTRQIYVKRWDGSHWQLLPGTQK